MNTDKQTDELWILKFDNLIQLLEAEVRELKY